MVYYVKKSERRSPDFLDYWSVRLAAVCIAIFIAQVAFPAITGWFVLVSSDLMSRPWILVSHIFLHGSPSHMLYNMLALVLFGSILENIIGHRNFLALFFASGIVAGLASSLFYPASLGASGAIFGLLGCLAVLRPRMTVWVYYIPMPMIAAAAVWAFLDMLGIFFPSNIANAAHLAGLASGLLVGYHWLKKYGNRTPKRHMPEKPTDDEIKRWEDKWMG